MYCRPEVSQLYTLESNKLRGNINPIVYKTAGTPINLGTIQSVAQNSQEPSHTLGGVPAQLGPFSGVNTPTAPAPSSRQRLSECLCYICKEKLGPEHSKRIGMSEYLLAPTNIGNDIFFISLYETRLLSVPCPSELFELFDTCLSAAQVSVLLPLSLPQRHWTGNCSHHGWFTQATLDKNGLILVMLICATASVRLMPPGPTPLVNRY